MLFVDFSAKPMLKSQAQTSSKAKLKPAQKTSSNFFKYQNYKTSPYKSAVFGLVNYYEHFAMMVVYVHVGN